LLPLGCAADLKLTPRPVDGCESVEPAMSDPSGKKRSQLLRSFRNPSPSPPNPAKPIVMPIAQ